MKTGILLVNLGTPDSPHPKDVKRYLIEFLTDPRVIDTSWLMRQFLVRGIIVPKRYKNSAASYQAIWTKEGSPLMVYGKKVQQLLQQKLGSDYVVELTMRYQNPPIKQGLHNLIKAKVDKLIILPLFPQYASATTGSVHQKVMEEVKKYQVIPEMHFIEQYATHPKILDAFAMQGKHWTNYDHILFSFHGLPERQLIKANSQCLTSKCCEKNNRCYLSQCKATAKGIIERLQIPPDKYTICFQSRLGKDPWIKPYASEVIEHLAKQGRKKILVFCPSFICDCLETIFEFGVEYQKEFRAQGGEQIDLVPGLNDHPYWIETLAALVKP